MADRRSYIPSVEGYLLVNGNAEPVQLAQGDPVEGFWEAGAAAVKLMNETPAGAVELVFAALLTREKPATADYLPVEIKPGLWRYAIQQKTLCPR